MRALAFVLLSALTAAGLGQTPSETSKFQTWCAHYGRVRVMMSDSVECARHVRCDVDDGQLQEELARLNKESDQTSLIYFWKENAAIWKLIHCELVIVNENLEWTNRILGGASRKPLPMTDELRECKTDAPPAVNEGGNLGEIFP